MRKRQDAQAVIEIQRKRRHLLAKTAVPGFVLGAAFCVAMLALSTFLESTVLALQPPREKETVEAPRAASVETQRWVEVPPGVAAVAGSVEVLPALSAAPPEPDVQAIRKQTMEVLEREIEHHAQDIARQGARIKELEAELAECRARP